MSQRFFLMLLFVVGIIFRLWFARLVPQPFVYDQDEYYGYALGILQQGLHGDIYRLYGYPLLITPLVYFFGIKSPMPWIVFHAILDALTTILIFLLARKMFRSPWVAWVAGLLYAVNPYTSGYVGVLLSEVTTIFLITLIAYLSVLYFEKRTVRFGIFLVLLLGILPHVRPAYIYFTLGMLFLLLINMWKSQKDLLHKIKTCILIGFFYFIPFTYTVGSNLVYYHEFSLLSVDRVFAREFYASIFIDRGLPFTDTSFGVWPKEAMESWGAFSEPKNKNERDMVAKKYIAKAEQHITADPWRYVGSRFRKMLYVWEKHFVYPYAMGRMTPLTKLFIYWSNMTLLTLGLYGLVRTIADREKVVYARRFIAWFTASLVVYISLIHSISTSEERFSLPAYPLIFLFAGYGVCLLFQSLKRKLTTSTIR